MEDIDGGLHPAVYGQSLDEDEVYGDILASNKIATEEQYCLQRSHDLHTTSILTTLSFKLSEPLSQSQE